MLDLAIIASAEQCAGGPKRYTFSKARTMYKQPIISSLALLLLPFFGAAQNLYAIADSLQTEGKRIYQSEITSWHGSDLFIDKYKETNNIGGYFSYKENQAFKCVFINKGPNPKVIGTVVLDSSFNPKKAQTLLVERELTTLERDYWQLRTAAYAALKDSKQFAVYENTSLNIVPLIDGEERKAYVLTGPKSNGLVIFGNDCLLRFNGQNELISFKKIHNNIMPIEFDPTGINDPVGAVHSHNATTGEFITATDICTLLLYQKFARWSTYFVTGPNHFSIWNCTKNELQLLTREDWEKNNPSPKKKGRH